VTEAPRLGAGPLDAVVAAYVAWSVQRHRGLSLDALRAIWPVAVGRAWAERTTPVGLRGRILEVAVPDAVWQSESRFHSERILARLNALLGEAVRPFEEIRFRVGGAPNWHPTRDRKVSPPPERALTEAEERAAATIRDPELRALVTRVARRDLTREHE
jgi:hypothetical protein